MLLAEGQPMDFKRHGKAIRPVVDIVVENVQRHEGRKSFAAAALSGAREAPALVDAGTGRHPTLLMARLTALSPRSSF